MEVNCFSSSSLGVFFIFPGYLVSGIGGFWPISVVHVLFQSVKGLRFMSWVNELAWRKVDFNYWLFRRTKSCPPLSLRELRTKVWDAEERRADAFNGGELRQRFAGRGDHEGRSPVEGWVWEWVLGDLAASGSAACCCFAFSPGKSLDSFVVLRVVGTPQVRDDEALAA